MTMTPLLAPLAAFALLAVAPTPAPSASADASQARTLSIVCDQTPLWLFPTGSGVNVPIRAAEPEPTLGQRFGLISGPRVTLEGLRYYETNVIVVEPGYFGQHYWLTDDCAIPSS